MKIFLSFRFTGEDPLKLAETNKKIVGALAKSGHTIWHSLDAQAHFVEHQFSSKQILEHSLRELDSSDALLAYINSEERSEGMLIEIGYAMAKGKKIII